MQILLTLVYVYQNSLLYDFPCFLCYATMHDFISYFHLVSIDHYILVTLSDISHKTFIIYEYGISHLH